MNEYRIIKNRRPIGPRYLVQQGQWRERTSNLTGRTRRVFEYVWEREFITRRAAEAFVESEELRLAGQEAARLNVSRPETFEVPRPDGSKVRVTVPEDDPAEPAKELRDLLADCMSPQAVAAIVAYLQPVRTNNPDVDRQVHWFAEQLVKLLGGDKEQNRLAEELGL